MTRVEKAIENHKNFSPCSVAVLRAFCDEAGMTSEQATAAARPMAGGRMTKCGAVLAARQVLISKFGEQEGGRKAEQLEQEFFSKNGAVNCRELKGIGTGKMLRSCRGCVTDAAEILDKMLG